MTAQLNSHNNSQGLPFAFKYTKKQQRSEYIYLLIFE